MYSESSAASKEKRHKADYIGKKIAQICYLAEAWENVPLSPDQNKYQALKKIVDSMCDVGRRSNPGFKAEDFTFLVDDTNEVKPVFIPYIQEIKYKAFRTLIYDAMDSTHSNLNEDAGQNILEVHRPGKLWKKTQTSQRRRSKNAVLPPNLSTNQGLEQFDKLNSSPSSARTGNSELAVFSNLKRPHSPNQPSVPSSSQVASGADFLDRAVVPRRKRSANRLQNKDKQAGELAQQDMENQESAPTDALIPQPAKGNLDKSLKSAASELQSCSGSTSEADLPSRRAIDAFPIPQTANPLISQGGASPLNFQQAEQAGAVAPVFNIYTSILIPPEAIPFLHLSIIPLLQQPSPCFPNPSDEASQAQSYGERTSSSVSRPTPKVEPLKPELIAELTNRFQNKNEQAADTAQGSPKHAIPQLIDFFAEKETPKSSPQDVRSKYIQQHASASNAWLTLRPPKSPPNVLKILDNATPPNSPYWDNQPSKSR